MIGAAMYTTIKTLNELGIKGKEIFIRLHTPAGHEAQVDFGYVGRTKDDAGASRKTWVFNMRLSHSRFDYYEKVYDQKVETLINCHANAFEYFKGVPEVVKIDNLKAAILDIARDKDLLASDSKRDTIIDEDLSQRDSGTCL